MNFQSMNKYGKRKDCNEEYDFIWIVRFIISFTICLSIILLMDSIFFSIDILFCIPVGMLLLSILPAKDLIMESSKTIYHIILPIGFILFLCCMLLDIIFNPLCILFYGKD